MTELTSSILVRWKTHFANWREWEMNPIVIKELRQAVRSWAVTGMLLLFLAVLFITSLVFLVTQTFQVEASLRLGASMFSAFIVILAGASVLFIPLYVGIRVAGERVDNNPDLLYVSTLSPARIIRGKFLCGAYVAVLFFSACMPFMAFTNLLRGVDLPTVFFILFYLFLVVCAANMVGIFLACLPLSRPFKILLAIGGFFQPFAVLGSLLSFSFGLMRSGAGSMMSGRTFWIGTLTFVIVILAVTGLFYVLSVALISPPSANRALPVRAYITGMWLLGGIVSIAWVMKTGEGAIIYSWTYPTFVLMLIALLVTISNSDQLSLRVRRTIPTAGIKRGLAFLFFNGAAGGLIWAAFILTVTYVLSSQVSVMFPKSMAISADAVVWFPSTAIYALAYGLTALFIHRKFFPRAAPKIAGVLAVALAAAWAVVPSIVLFFLNQLSWKAVEGFQPGNMFNVFAMRDSSLRGYHMLFASAWLLIILLVNARWFAQQVKNFRPFTPARPEDSPPVLQ